MHTIATLRQQLFRHRTNVLRVGHGVVENPLSCNHNNIASGAQRTNAARGVSARLRNRSAESLAASTAGECEPRQRAQVRSRVVPQAFAVHPLDVLFQLEPFAGNARSVSS
jgi:hypothetical protein